MDAQSVSDAGTEIAEINSEQYEDEKELGLRRADGSKNLKSLKPIHHKIISLFVGGNKQSDIAREVRMTDATISRIIGDPLVKDILDTQYDLQSTRLRALSEKAVDVVGDAMDSDNIGTRLRGVDRFAKLNDSLGKGVEKEATAEDVIQRIMNNIQINLNVNT